MTLRRNVAVRDGVLTITRLGGTREYPLFHFQGVESICTLMDRILGTRSLRLTGGVRVIIPNLRAPSEAAELLEECIRQARRAKRAEVRSRCGLEPFVTPGAQRRRAL